MSQFIRRCVAFVVLSLGMGFLVAPDMAMAWKDGGPTASDFVRDGVFDQSGYLAALVAFETAPVLANDRPITVKVEQCPVGGAITVLFVGFPPSQQQLTSTGSPTNAVVAPPVGAGTGFNVVRVTCVASQSPTTSMDIVVDLRPASTPGAATTIVASLSSGSTGGLPGTGGSTGGLPRAGSDLRAYVGYGTAALLVGIAVVLGARRRFHVAAV